MTSFTSASAGPSSLKSALAYLAATLFCALFGAVYELFSHGVYSYFMIYAFALPAVLGLLPNLLAARGVLRAPGKLAANAWNAGVATLAVGSIFQGALDIFGTTSQLAFAYPVAGAILLVAGLVFHLRAGRARVVRCHGTYGRIVHENREPQAMMRGGGHGAESWECRSGCAGKVRAS